MSQPYLDGAESSQRKRIAPENLAEQLSVFDVVSLDVFDTAVFRLFCVPTDLFMVLGERLDFTDFYQMRINAEAQARQIRKQSKGDAEVGLEEIYERLEHETGIPKVAGMEAEIAAELDFSFPNPYIQNVYKILKKIGKTIVFTSDMYLGESAIRRILKRCGYMGDERIFVSCEYRCAKRDGQLFRRMRAAMGEGLRYAHIGDNELSDVRSAEQEGLTAIYYENVNAAGSQWRAPGLSELTGSIYRGLVNAHLHNGLQIYSVSYEHGFVYGGLCVLGFTRWIQEYCDLHGITKVLFLSRDGAIYHRVFDLLENHQESSYVYWSRIPTICLMAAKDRHNFLQRGLRERIDDVEKMTVEDCLKMLRLETLIAHLPAYSIEAHEELATGNIRVLEQLIRDFWDDVLKIYEVQETAAKRYLETLIGSHKRVAVVDTGWHGSGPLSIQWLVEDRWCMNVKVDCLIAASNSRAVASLPRVMRGKIAAYLFDWSKNREHAEFHSQTNSGCNNAFFELFAQAAQPTFEAFGWDGKNVNFQFGFASVENYETLRQIHQGILDFSRAYLTATAFDSYLLRISGYDAYLPFRFLASHPEYFRKFFGEFKFRNTIGECRSTRDLETLEDLMEKSALIASESKRKSLKNPVQEEIFLRELEHIENQKALLESQPKASEDEVLMKIRAFDGIIKSIKMRLGNLGF